jgi:hypothetical protein
MVWKCCATSHLGNRTLMFIHILGRSLAEEAVQISGSRRMPYPVVRSLSTQNDNKRNRWYDFILHGRQNSDFLLKSYKRKGWKEKLIVSWMYDPPECVVICVWNWLSYIFIAVGVGGGKTGFCKKQSTFVWLEPHTARQVRFHLKSSPASAAYFARHLFLMLEFVSAWSKISSRCYRILYNYERSEGPFDVLTTYKASASFFLLTQRQRTAQGSSGSWPHFRI